MSVFDDVLKAIGGAPDDVTNLAEKVGIDPGMAEKAIAALGHAHQMQGDTVDLASAKTGLPKGTLNQIVEHIGGEGSLTEFARMVVDNPQAAGILQMLDRDGDGSVLDDAADFAKGLFGKK
ncbi:MAG TPA: hypothetical protein VLA37_04175 [Sphingomonadaceae bacterium]|nr:hypothetical protein [Sphingomonadaceae bacterium]